MLAARAALEDELVRLEATARAAVDIRAKVKRNPGRTAAVVGGTAFVAVGGPRRVLRSVKHRVFGVPDPLPPSLLPEQVEKAVRALGDDGTKVRGALEREFAAFVDTNRKGDSKFVRRHPAHGRRPARVADRPGDREARLRRVGGRGGEPRGADPRAPRRRGAGGSHPLDSCHGRVAEWQTRRP